VTFTSISKSKFEAHFYGRSPYIKQFTTETVWFSYHSGDITLLAVVLFDKTDKDYNVIVLGRDLNRKFRPVHTLVSFPTIEAAINIVNEDIPVILELIVDGAFPQGDEKPSTFAIFASKVAAHKQNRYLKMLLSDPVYYPARVVMEELAHWFEDPDGIFIRGLQGNEFNSRLFELYLQAAFYELDFIIDHSHPQPDYLLFKAGRHVAVEAVTVAELEEDEDVDTPIDESMISALMKHVNNEMPFKFHRTLAKKVRHRPEPTKLPYWDMPHTKGHPFVIAIHDYSKNMSMATSAGALQKYLYVALIADYRSPR